MRPAIAPRSFRAVYRLLCIAASVLLIAPAAPALADPPARVGRITLVESHTQFFADREEGWQPAQINFPISGENSLWNDGRGRAEVRIGGSAIRIGDDSAIDFMAIDEERIDTYLQRGTATFRLRQYGNLGIAETLSVETGEGQFLLDAGGRYRVDAGSDGGESRLTVFFGRGRYENGTTRLTIDRGQTLIVRSQGGATDFRFESAIETAFDRWADSRDQQWDRTHVRYTEDNLISPYMTGYEELDQHGDWLDDREYGRLWAPRVVSSSWAPYRYGRWTHVRPWGWTWIDDAPWGFAPFHYGRWVQVRSRWCWWPGTYQARPVYAPALVAWIGTPGVGISISSGPSVGWFPLAPREYYVPRYSYSAGYGRRINYITNNNITVITPPANYRNHVPGATIVPNATFVNGNPVGSSRVQLPPRDIAFHRPSTYFDAAPRPRRTQPTEISDRANGHGQGHAPRPRFPIAGTSPGGIYPPVTTAPSNPGAFVPDVKRRPEPASVGPLVIQKGPADTVRGVVPGDPQPPPAQPPQQRRRNVPVLPANDGQPAQPQIPPVTVYPAPVPTVDRDYRPAQPARQPQRPQNEGVRTLPPPGGIPAAPAVSAPSYPSAPRQIVPDAGPAAVKPAPDRGNKPRAEMQKEVQKEVRKELRAKDRERDGDGTNRPKKD